MNNDQFWEGLLMGWLSFSVIFCIIVTGWLWYQRDQARRRHWRAQREQPLEGPGPAHPYVPKPLRYRPHIVGGKDQSY